MAGSSYGKRDRIPYKVEILHTVRLKSYEGVYL